MGGCQRSQLWKRQQLRWRGYMNNGTALDTDIQTYVTNHTPPGIDTTKITTTGDLACKRR